MNYVVDPNIVSRRRSESQDSILDESARYNNYVPYYPDGEQRTYTDPDEPTYHYPDENEPTYYNPTYKKTYDKYKSPTNNNINTETNTNTNTNTTTNNNTNNNTTNKKKVTISDKNGNKTLEISENEIKEFAKDHKLELIGVGAVIALIIIYKII